MIDDAVAQNHQYRVIENGVGNCIFANAPLQLGKEAQYKGVAQKFKTGDLIEARCYFAKTLNEFSSLGRLRNSLREGKYYSLLLVHSPKYRTNQTVKKIAPWIYDANKKTWNQGRHVFDPNDRYCDFKDSHGSPAGCVDLDKSVRELASMEKASLPYTGRVCLTTYIKIADNETHTVNWNENTVTSAAAVGTKVLAEGCFDYTVTK